MKERLTPARCLPVDHERALLVGRMHVPALEGPVVVRVTSDDVLDLSALAPTLRDLLELGDPAQAVRGLTDAPRIASTRDVLANCDEATRNAALPWFLAPCDLQAVKAAGVTFVSSMLERVIEEQARGDPAKAERVRAAVVGIIGENLRSVRPGSPEASRLKDALIAQGVWSQYLEVGIGPDAEIFTKTQPMASVGPGADIGIHPKSAWNNPEPEVVLAVDSRGRTLGATLGNDVNLRDFEGRSALLLGKAKDNNASCAIGPFVRLFDADFGMDDVRGADIALTVEGPDGFTLRGSSPIREISRDPLDLVAAALNENHQYPDGLVLFLGTMFAPIEDRYGPGQGFTHAVGDIVTISSPSLGALVNRVEHSDRIAPWTFGAGALMRNLARRGLI
ncbi:MAG TPA: fumarylacetoacetate hydrolase family protein [Casimicrobiaceae bacterium]|jgi:fumarylacetoacetate (FAA) hydrolase family protein